MSDAQHVQEVYAAHSSPGSEAFAVGGPLGPEAPREAVHRAIHGIRVCSAGSPWRARRGPRLWSASDEWETKLELPESERLAELLAELRAMTARYTCCLRADGARPERMLPQVKHLVREAMQAEAWGNPAAEDALMAQVVRWSIEAYYDLAN